MDSWKPPFCKSRTWGNLSIKMSVEMVHGQWISLSPSLSLSLSISLPLLLLLSFSESVSCTSMSIAPSLLIPFPLLLPSPFHLPFHLPFDLPSYLPCPELPFLLPYSCFHTSSKFGGVTQLHRASVQGCAQQRGLRPPPHGQQHLLSLRNFSGDDKRVVSKRVVLADVPPERKPEWGYIRMFPPERKPEQGYVRMFPRNENQNEGTFAKTTLLRNHPLSSCIILCKPPTHKPNNEICGRCGGVWLFGKKCHYKQSTKPKERGHA